jgi:hypothetical protein
MLQNNSEAFIVRVRALHLKDFEYLAHHRMKRKRPLKAFFFSLESALWLEI